MAADRSYSAGRFGFAVDGKFAGFIKKVSGGTVKGEVATHAMGTSLYLKKHLATIAYEACTMEISMGMGKDCWDWIKASLDQGFVQKTCELHAADFNGKVRAVRVFKDAYIKKFTIPKLAGDAKEPAYFTIEIDPETIRYEGGSGDLSGDENVNSKKWLCSNYRIEVDGLPCERVSSFDSVSWEQKVVLDQVGQFRDSKKEPAAVELSNLKLQISMADIKPWMEWHKSFVIDGVCTDADEKTLSVEFLSPDLKDTLMTITFGHVGIISLQQMDVEARKEEVARFEVELYAETMTIDQYKVELLGPRRGGDPV